MRSCAKPDLALRSLNQLAARSSTDSADGETPPSISPQETACAFTGATEHTSMRENDAACAFRQLRRDEYPRHTCASAAQPKGEAMRRALRSRACGTWCRRWQGASSPYAADRELGRGRCAAGVLRAALRGAKAVPRPVAHLYGHAVPRLPDRGDPTAWTSWNRSFGACRRSPGC